MAQKMLSYTHKTACLFDRLSKRDISWNPKLKRKGEKNEQQKICIEKIFIILMIVFVSLLAGCTDKGTNGQGVSGGNEPVQSTDTDADTEIEDDIKKVNSVEDFLEAIKPGAKIYIEAGKYNLMEFLQKYSEPADYEGWNVSHAYVELVDAYDGIEVNIKNVKDLEISGSPDDKTKIVTNSSYATVLNFDTCSDIELTNLEIGHTDVSQCSGDVLGFSNTRGITLSKLDLYGCGVNGIACYYSSGDLKATELTIHDCSYGPLNIVDGAGKFTFEKCSFVDSERGGYYEDNENSELIFDKCAFGQEESNTWSFREDVTANDCSFMEPSAYPEYSNGE